MQSVANELHDKTLTYWRLSRLVHRGEGPNYSTTQAIHILSDLMDYLGPARQLLVKTHSLQNVIINGVKRKPKVVPRNNLVQIRIAK